MKRSVVLGIGHYVPSKVVTNEDLAKLMDTSDEWIQQRTGIKERRYVENKDIGNRELAYEATQVALKRAGLEARDLDMIILASLSPDHQFPGDGCFLQGKLGIPGIPAIDIRQQCTGFVYGISIADQFIRSGGNKKILVVGTEAQSKWLDFTTRGRDVSVIFADGAGAAILGESDVDEGDSKARGVLSTHLHADGTKIDDLWMDITPNQNIPQDLWEAGHFYPKMNGRAVFMIAIKKFPEVIKEALDANKMSIGDVDLFVFHQANLRIVQAVAKAMGIPMEKTFNNIQKYGNTTAASIPIALSEAVEQGKLKKNDVVCVSAFGSGLTWASTLIRW